MDGRTPALPRTSGRPVSPPGQQVRGAESPVASGRRRWPKPSPAPRRTRSPPAPPRATKKRDEADFEAASSGSSISDESERAVLVSAGKAATVCPPSETRQKLRTHPRPKSPTKRSFQQPAGWLRREMGDAPYVAAPVQESPDGDKSTAALLVSDVPRDDPAFSAPIEAPQGRKARGSVNPPSVLATTSRGRPEVAQRSGKPATHSREMTVYVQLRKPDKETGGGVNTADTVTSEQETRTSKLLNKTGDPGAPKDSSVVGSEVSLTVDTSIQHRKASLLQTISASVSAALGRFLRKGPELPAPAPRSGNVTQKEGTDRHRNLLPAEIGDEMKAADVSDGARTRDGQHSERRSTSYISINQVVSVKRPAETRMPQARASLKHKLEDRQRRRSPQSSKEDSSAEAVDEVPSRKKEATGKIPQPKQRQKGRKAPERPSRDQEQLVQPLPRGDRKADKEKHEDTFMVPGKTRHRASTAAALTVHIEKAGEPTMAERSEMSLEKLQSEKAATDFKQGLGEETEMAHETGRPDELQARQDRVLDKYTGEAPGETRSPSTRKRTSVTRDAREDEQREIGKKKASHATWELLGSEEDKKAAKKGSKESTTGRYDTQTTETKSKKKRQSVSGTDKKTGKKMPSNERASAEEHADPIASSAPANKRRASKAGRKKRPKRRLSERTSDVTERTIAEGSEEHDGAKIEIVGGEGEGRLEKGLHKKHAPDSEDTEKPGIGEAGKGRRKSSTVKKSKRKQRTGEEPETKDEAEANNGTTKEPVPLRRSSRATKPEPESGSAEMRAGKMVDTVDSAPDLGKRQPSVAAESKAQMTKTAVGSGSGADPERHGAEADVEIEEKEAGDDHKQEDAQTGGAFEHRTQRRASAGDKKSTRRDSDLKGVAQEDAGMAEAKGKEPSRQGLQGKYEESVRSPDEAGKSILRTDAKSKSHAIPFKRRLSTKSTSERFAAALQRDEGPVSPKDPKQEGTDGRPGDTYDASAKPEASHVSPKSKRHSRDEGRRPSKSDDREERKEKNKGHTSRRVSESARSKRKRSTGSRSEKSKEDRREALDGKKEGEEATVAPHGGGTKEDEAVAGKPPKVAEQENAAAEVDQDKHGVSDGRGASQKKGRRKSKTRAASMKGGAEGLEPKRGQDRKAREEQDVQDANQKLRTMDLESKRPATSGEGEAQAGDSKTGGPMPMKEAGVSTLTAGQQGEILPETGPMDTAEKHRQKGRGDEGDDRGSRRQKTKKQAGSRRASDRRKSKSKKKSKPEVVESVEVSVRCAETQTCLAAPVVDAGGASCRDFNFGMTLSPYTTGTLARKEVKTAGAIAVTSGEPSSTKPKEGLKEVTPPSAPQESNSPPEKNAEDKPGTQTKRGKRKKRSKLGTTDAADKKKESSKAKSKSGRRSKSKRGKKRKRPSEKQEEAKEEKQDEESKAAAKPEDDKHEKSQPKELGDGENEKDINENKDNEPKPKDPEREGESGPEKRKRKKKSAKGKKGKRRKKTRKEDRKEEADGRSTGEVMPFLFRWGPATIPIFIESAHPPREDAGSTRATVSTKDATHGLPLSSAEFPPPEEADKPPVPAVDGLENEPAADVDSVPKKEVAEESPKEPERKKKSRSKGSKKKRGRSKGSKKKRSRSKGSAERPEGDRSSKKGKRGSRLKGSLKHPKRTSKTEEERPFGSHLGPSDVPTSAGAVDRPLSWSTMQIGPDGGERHREDFGLAKEEAPTKEGAHDLLSSKELPSPGDQAQAPPAADVDVGPKDGVTDESPKKPKRKKKSRSKDSKKKRGRSKGSKKKRSRSKGPSEPPEGDRGGESRSYFKYLKSTSKDEEEKPFSFQCSPSIRPLSWSTMQTGPHAGGRQSPRGDVSPTKATVSRKDGSHALHLRSSDRDTANEAVEQEAIPGDVSKGSKEEHDSHVSDGATKELARKRKTKEARFHAGVRSAEPSRPKRKRRRSKGSKKKRSRSKGSKKKRTRSKGSKKKRTRSKGSKQKRSRSKGSSRGRKGGRGSKKGKRQSSKQKREAEDGTKSPERKGRKRKSSRKSGGSSKRSAAKRKSDKKARPAGDGPEGVPSPQAPSSTEEQLTREQKAEDKASAKHDGGEEHRDFDFDISRRPVITGSHKRRKHKKAREPGLVTASEGAASSLDEKGEGRKRHVSRKTAKRKLDRDRPSKTTSPASPASPASRQERVPAETSEKKFSSDSGVPGRRRFDFAICQRPVTRGTLPRPELTQTSEPEIVAAFERMQGAFVSPETTGSGEEAARYASKSSSRERGKRRSRGKRHRERKARKSRSRSTRSKSRHPRSKSGSRRSKSKRSRRSGKSPRSSSRSRRKKHRRSRSRSKKSKSRESSRSKRRRRHRRDSSRRRKHGKHGGRRSRSRSSKRRHKRKKKSEVHITEAYSSASEKRRYWYLGLSCLVILLMVALCVVLLYYALVLRAPTTGTAPPEPSTTPYTTETETSSERPPRTGTIEPRTVATTPATVSTPKPTPPTPPPDTHAYSCSSDYCQREGRYISSLLRRETDPCDNFYQHVCARWVQNHVQGVPFNMSLVSENTLVQDALLNKLIDVVLSSKHGDVQVAAKLYSACYEWSQSNDRSSKNLKTVFSQWTIGNWPRTAAVPDGAAAVWRFAAELVRDIGLTTIVTASVGVNPDSLDATLVELDQPVPPLRDAGSDNRDVRHLFASAVQEAMNFLGGTSTDAFVDKLLEVRAALAALCRPSYGHSDDDHVNFVVRQYGQLGQGLREFLRVLLTNVRSRVNLSEKVVLRSAPYLLEELDGKLNQMPPVDVLNYMGFLVFVHVSPFLPLDSVTRARLLFAESTMGYTAGASDRKPLCSRLAEWALPECFVKASQMWRQSTNQDVPAREWLSQLESVFLRHVVDFVWMNDLTSLLVRYRLKRRATTQFGQLAGEQRQCAPRERLNTDDPVLSFFNLSQHLQQRMFEGLVANSSVLRKRTAISDLSGVATFRPELQTIHVPAGLFNASVPSNSSVFVFHLARVAVRFYRALVQLLYENPYEREVPLSFTDESRRRQAALVACFGKDSQRALPSFQGSYEAQLGRTFLDRTSALQLSLKAFDELFNVRRIWKLDLRLQGLEDMSAEQLFFIYFALDNCEYAHPEIHRELLPAEQRVNLPLRHTRRFADAFHCRGQSPMAARDGDFCQVLRSDRRFRHALKASRSRSSDDAAVPAP